MRFLLKGRIGCVVLAAVVAGLGVASAAGASSKVSAPKFTTTRAAGGVADSAAGSSLVFGSVVIFSNLGPGGSYSCCVGWTVSESASVVGFQRVATPFTPTSGAQVTRIDVALGHLTGTNNATVQLAADNGGLPGAILRTWLVFGQPALGTCCTLTTVNTGTLVPVGAGRQYWVIVTAGPNVANDTWDAWNWNSVGDSGTFAFDTGSGWALAGATRGAFDVIGCSKLCKVT